MITRALILLMALLVSASACAAPKVVNIELKPFTQYVVYMPKGMGTKFTLPFIINEADQYTPFSKIVTHPAFKHLPVTGESNSFVVYLPPDAPEHVKGDLFFNIAGYEATVELIESDDLKKHVTDVNFTLGNKARNQLIQDLVAKRTKVIESEYLAKLDAARDQDQRQVLEQLAVLVLAGGKTRAVDEKKSTELPNGDKVTVSVNEMKIYGKYTIIPLSFNLDSDNDDGIQVKAVRLFSRDFKTGQLTPISAGTQFPKRLKDGKPETGTLAYLSSVHNPQQLLSVQVLVGDKTTDKTIKVSW